MPPAEAKGGMKTMKRMKVGVMLLALLLAAMAMVPMVSASENQNSSTLEGFATPDFSTQEITTTPPLSESDMIYILFPENWVLENDMSEIPGYIELPYGQNQAITAKNSSLSSIRYYVPVPIQNNQRVSLLKMPKKMFEVITALNNTELQVPSTYFTHYTNESIAIKKLNTVIKSDLASTATIYPAQRTATASYPIHGQWAHFYPRSSYTTNLNHLSGTISPSTWTTNGQDGAIYQEREIYLNNNDVVELILYYRYTALYGRQVFLGATVYDNGVAQSSPQTMWIDASSMHSFNYDFIATGGHYYIWYQDRSTSTTWQADYNDSNDPSTYITRITGSSEVYTDNPAQYTFNAITTAITDTVDGTTGGSSLLSAQAFYFYAPSGDGIYSQTTDNSNSNFIITSHRNSNTI